MTFHSARERTLSLYEGGLPDKVLGFFNDHRPLSNFHLEPFTWDGQQWPSSENAYQAAKHTDMGDDVKTTFAALTPGRAKELGQTIDLRTDWDILKVGIMTEILHAKFIQCPIAMASLLSTGTAHLEECNWWGDRFWGTVNGYGQNKLGTILMQIRYRICTSTQGITP